MQSLSWADARGIWENLEQKNPGAEYYLRTSWISAWVHTYAVQYKPRFIAIFIAKEPVGIFMSFERLVWVYGIPIKTLYINTGGEQEYTGPHPAWNEILTSPGYESEVIATLAQYIESYSCTRVHIGNTKAGFANYLLSEDYFKSRCINRATVPNFIFDLRTLQPANRFASNARSKNLRKKLRKSKKLYEKEGKLELQRAKTLAEAIRFFDALCDLKLHALRKDGQQSSLRDRSFKQFHYALIERDFLNGKIDLLRLVVGEKTIAYVYNFLHKKSVYCYQAAVLFELNQDLKPGYICDWLLLDYYKQRGYERYDFLDGYNQLKERLSTNQEVLRPVIILKNKMLCRLFSKILHCRYS